MAAKMMLNSAWGKGVQRATMPETVILNHETQMDLVDSMFRNFEKKKKSLELAYCITANTYMYKTINIEEEISPDLHGGYAPSSIMVPAYGRVQLFEQLNLLQERVLYHDTDSIIYLYKPGEYSIPLGTTLGEWDEEAISKKGIVEFVSLGPKTYGLKTIDGETLIKAKGLSLGHSTSSLVNFESMKSIALAYLEGKKKVIKVPQQSFAYGFEKGMSTWNMVKDLKLNPEDFKGVFDKETGYIWPFGSNKV